eukprot:TRINITY_DN46162_c0_g1_i1.p1 TRINITY_DN46162_c0_g1~~TRINITY_DN46162_c0_g1_i1.p1  ORF type:complete len:323 (-),score=52.45 TRINITY_DN46162_c0_g1_i1:82-1050(-)
MGSGCAHPSVDSVEDAPLADATVENAAVTTASGATAVAVGDNGSAKLAVRAVKVSPAQDSPQAKKSPAPLLEPGDPLQRTMMRILEALAASAPASQGRRVRTAVPSRPGTAAGEAPPLGADVLVSPQNVSAAADRLGVDLVVEPYLFGVVRDAVRSLARKVAAGEALDAKSWHDAVARSRALEANKAQTVAAPSAKGTCAECEAPCECFCPECEDAFCDRCFVRLHAKGNRALHPRLGPEFAKVSSIAGPSATLGLTLSHSVQASTPTAAGSRGQSGVACAWHEFLDSSGAPYFHSFSTGKSVRTVLDEDLAWRPPPPLPVV